MKYADMFRATENFTLKDEDAGLRRLGAAAAGVPDAKQLDKELTRELAQHIAEWQDVFTASRSKKLLIILQGMDTSGKDGTVKAVFGDINPLGARTVAFKAPTQQEKDHDYLWRIHQAVPGAGEIVIFNRSHYEDVLITRVHDWISEKECEQRYGHIRDFERMLTDTGTVILKFFLHISKAEQKQRLEERLKDPQKHWKFDPSDLAERAHWDAYQRAYENAVRATNAPHAPWFIVPADSKTQRNLVIAHIVREILDNLQLKYPAPHPEYASIRVPD
ncbi:PPK2 family polyphosphate kinase [Undibacterium luofuense]|uniref:Polyphosphate kinase 2 family protein n=1 Tax=Undibacterium luofuense TaxID=2828733 RepID=A0A941DP22_9BURK|nr:PPK2 family polyphosphate kinase [Undibacterium luofuense]MBR7783435.1 polyphosphate kinase 2 family protein [Undibacterium luofuense]